MNYEIQAFRKLPYVGAQWFAHGSIIRQTKPMETIPEGYFYLPTLEEVIEAIGADFVIGSIRAKILKHLTPQALGEYWLALNKKV